MNEGGTTLRRPFRIVAFYFVGRRKSYALYDWWIALQREVNNCLLLTQQYGLLHIKLDDLTDQMMDQARANAKPISLLRQDRSPDQIWLRHPEEMADEEWRFYEEIFPYVASYLLEHQEKPLLVEGAGLLPHLVKSLDGPAVSYLCLTPTADFQTKHYQQREWVPYVLEDTSNPEQAFENWMQRDILFAQMVRKEAKNRLS